jgi:Tol biopolymer transport system component
MQCKRSAAVFVTAIILAGSGALAESAPIVQATPQASIVVLDSVDGSPSEDWHTLREAMVADLERSGQFILVEPDRSSTSENNLDVVPHFDRWRGLGVEWLVVGRVQLLADQRQKANFRLWKVATGKDMLGQQYVVKPEERSHVPHIMSEAIIKRVTEAVRYHRK